MIEKRYAEDNTDLFKKFWSLSGSKEPFDNFLKACEKSTHLINVKGISSEMMYLKSTYDTAWTVMKVKKESTFLIGPLLDSYTNHMGIIKSLFPGAHVDKNLHIVKVTTTVRDINLNYLQYREGML